MFLLGKCHLPFPKLPPLCGAETVPGDEQLTGQSAGVSRLTIDLLDRSLILAGKKLFLCCRGGNLLSV